MDEKMMAALVPALALGIRFLIAGLRKWVWRSLDGEAVRMLSYALALPITAGALAYLGLLVPGDPNRASLLLLVTAAVGAGAIGAHETIARKGRKVSDE